MQPYEKLLAWQSCNRLAHAIYDLTDHWPADERYQLTKQIRTAALGAATNIVEGSMRKGSAEFHRYLQMAFGSLAEVGYLLAFANRRGYLTAEVYEATNGLKEDASRLTFLLLASLSNRS